MQRHRWPPLRLQRRLLNPGKTKGARAAAVGTVNAVTVAGARAAARTGVTDAGATDAGAMARMKAVADATGVVAKVAVRRARAISAHRVAQSAATAVTAMDHANVGKHSPWYPAIPPPWARRPRLLPRTVNRVRTGLRAVSVGKVAVIVANAGKDASGASAARLAVVVAFATRKVPTALLVPWHRRPPVRQPMPQNPQRPTAPAVPRATNAVSDAHATVMGETAGNATVNAMATVAMSARKPRLKRLLSPPTMPWKCASRWHARTSIAPLRHLSP